MKNSTPKNRIALKGGTYSLIITAIVLAILIVVNICVGAISPAYTKYDISSSKLYSITSNTKVVANNLNKDVSIYWIVQADQEDDVLENLLAKYESLSKHIDVVKKNPDIYPTFAAQYTDETVSNNSIIVVSGERSRYIPYDKIYVTETDVYSYNSTTSFDGEGAITSAIDYVVREDLPQIYTLEGHGESELPNTFAEKIEKENIEVSALSLLNIDEIPEDARCLIIYAPRSDISTEEKTMLTDYVNNGGKLFVMAGPVEDAMLTNLNSIIGDYGAEAAEGIVIDTDREHYAFQTPYILIPDMQDSDITAPLTEANYMPLMPISMGLTVSETSTVTKILTTSDEAFSKVAGFSLDTYEKEDDDIDGPFALAVSAKTSAGGEIIWFADDEFLQDMYNAYSSGANADLAMNALSELVGETESISIRSKSLNYNYLTMTEFQGSTLKLCTIIVLPLVYLAIGIVILIGNRRKQNAKI